jgi:hypothetical protein
MEQCCGLLALEMVPGKQESTAIQHLSNQESENSLWRMRRSAFSCLWNSFVGPWQKKNFQESPAISAPILAKRTSVKSGACAEVHIPDYGTELWSRGSRNFSRKYCDFSTYLAKRGRAQSGACAEVKFPD